MPQPPMPSTRSDRSGASSNIVGRRVAAIIRHGDYQQIPGAPSAHQPFALTAAGEEQARAAANTIETLLHQHSGWRLTPVIDCSQQLRAWQTAEIIANQLGATLQQPLKVESFDALAERSVGAAANLTAEQIYTIIEQDPRYPPLPAGWKADSHFRLPLQGAESLLESGARVAQHLRQQMAQLSEQEETQLKLFVGHGASFRHAACHLGLLPFEQIARLSMYHGDPILFEWTETGPWRPLSGAWKVRGEGSDCVD